MLDELLLAECSVFTRVSEDLIHPVVLPDRAIGFDVPFKDAKGCSARCDPQSRLAFAKPDLRTLALGDIEVHAKDPT